MSQPQGSLSTDEALLAILRRGNGVEAITDEEVRQLRSQTGALLVERDEDNQVWRVRFDKVTPIQELRAQPENVDSRPMGVGNY